MGCDFHGYQAGGRFAMPTRAMRRTAGARPQAQGFSQPPAEPFDEVLRASARRHDCPVLQRSLWLSAASPQVSAPAQPDCHHEIKDPHGPAVTTKVLVLGLGRYPLKIPAFTRNSLGAGTHILSAVHQGKHLFLPRAHLMRSR
jgi:hypothetical protein